MKILLARTCLISVEVGISGLSRNPDMFGPFDRLKIDASNGCLYSVRYKMGNELAIRCLNIEKIAILQSRISIRWIYIFFMIIFVSYHTIL